MATGVKFYQDRIRRFTDTGPAQAHALAAAEAAGIGAKTVGGRGTGALARDVSQPKQVGVMHAQIGSDLPYAAIENFGGTIRPKKAKRLLIRGKRGGGRSSFGGPITASATEVQHTGKHYLEAARDAFPPRFIAHLKRILPG